MSDTGLALIIGILTGLIVLSLSLFALNAANKKSKVGKRIKSLHQDKTNDGFEENLDYPEFLNEEHKNGLADGMNKILKMLGFNPSKYEDTVSMRFAQAGVTSPNAIVYYAFMKKPGLPIASVFSILLITSDQEGASKIAMIILAFLLFIGGIAGADLYLKNRKDKRQVVLQRSFPDALDLILVCVESGLALDAALARVTRELEHAHPEITKELNKTRMELTLLNDRPRALQNLAERTDLVPFKALVGALLQSEKFGTSLTETLRVLSDDYRHTRLMAAENKAGRLPVIMTIPLVLFMLPAFLLIIMGPAILSAMDVWSNK